MNDIKDIQHEHIIEALSYRAMDRLLRHLTDAVAI
jgi:magnesium chelatase family protein